MKYSNTIEYNISTKLDSSGLTKLQSQIKQLENSMQQMANRELLNSDKVQAAKTQLEGLNTALTKSFNSSLGILDLSKFRTELDAGGVSAKGLQSAFSMMGAEGQAALNGLTTQIANFNGGMERTSSAVDKIFTTFSNTFRWGVVSSFFSQFMNAIHSSVEYVKELDDSLTQIMLVTDYNRDSMNEFARSANEAAKAVSMTTTGMTNASLIFAQQGYDLGQSQELATLSAKVANASQQDTATTSDQITAYMNAYGLENSIGELTQAMDNWALIANISAADVGELAQASQRAASMANAVGVSGEQLASQIATIESVTREAPEQIGNGLKTLYARFSDIAAGKEDEDGFTLGKVTSELNKIGVQVLDEMGQIRDVGDIMEDLMIIWDDLDQTSKVAASQALAGKYQVNRFMALMDNSDMYEEYKSATGESAAGTLDMMNEEYAQSIEGRSAKLQASLEGLFSTVFNTDDIYPWMDAAQGAVDLLQQFFDALGGGKTVLLGIITLLGRAFNQNIARSINDTIANRNLGKIREQNINSVNDTLDRVGIDRTQGIGAYISKTADQAKLGALNEAQYNAYMEDVQQWANATTALTASEKELQTNVDLINAIYAKTGADGAFKEGKDSPYNTVNLQENRKEVLDKIDNLNFAQQEQAAAQYANSLHQLSTVFKEVEKDTSDEQNKQEELVVSIQSAREALADFTSILGMSEEEAGQWDQAFENVAADLAALPEDSIEAEKALGRIYDRVVTLRKGLFEVDNNKEGAKKFVADASDTIQKNETQISFNETQEKRAGENAEARGQGIDQQQNIKAILDTMNAVQQLTFAWQAFQNLGSIWANTELTDGEKILQTIMNLSMAIPQLITGFGQLGTTIKNVGSFLQNSYFTALKEAAAAELENAKAVEAKQKQQKDAIEAEMAALKTQYEKIKNDRDEAQGEIFLIQLEVEKNQALVNTLSILDSTNQKTLEKAKAELEVAQSLVTEAQAQEALNKLRLNGLKQEYNAKEASGNLGNKERSKYRAAIAEGELLSKDDEAQTANAEAMVNEAKIKVQVAEEKQAASTAALTDAREKLTDSTNRLTAAEEKFASSKEKLQEIESKVTSTISGSLSVLSDFKNAQDTVAAASAKYAKVIGLAEKETLTLGNAVKGLPTAFAALADKIGLSVGGLGALIGVAAVAAVAIGGVVWAINKEAEEQKAQAEAIKLINQKITENATFTKESIASWEELKKTFEETGQASDDFKKALLEQAEAYGINDAKIDIAKGHYQELIDKIEEARTKALENEKVLANQQFIEANKNENPADKLSDEQREKLGIKKETKTEQIELNGAGLADMYGTPIVKRTDGYSQNAYEQLQLIQEAYDRDQRKYDKLTKDWSEAIANQDKAGVVATRAQMDSLSLEMKEYQDLLTEYSDITESVDKIKEDTLISRASADEKFKNILEKGNFEEVKNAIKETFELDETLKESIGDIDDSSIEELAAAMMTLYENTSKATDSAQILFNSYSQEDIDAILKKANLEGIDIKDYADIFKETGGAGVTKDQINVVAEEIDNLTASLKELEEAGDTSSDKYKSLQKDLQNAEGILQDLAVASLETSNGMDDLSEKWEDISAAINSGDPSAIAASYSQLQEILSELLNVDPSMITSEFMQNTDVLSALGDLANGDTEAIWRLREAFGDGDLVLNARLDALGFEGDREKLFNLVKIAQDQLPDLEVGAHLKSDEFTQGLQDMLNNTEISSEQMQAILDTFEGLGYDVQVEEVPFEVPNIDLKPSGGSITLGGTGAMSDLIGGAINKGLSLAFEGATSLYTEITGKEATMPKITLTKKGGSKGGDRYRSNTGGKGGGGGGKSCFVAGTLITTLIGFSPIEQIKQGDTVLSYNESLHQLEYSTVVQTMIHDVIEPIYTLYIKNEQLRVTGIHCFLISHDIFHSTPQWIPAADLQIGDWMFLADGTWHLIHNIEVNVEHQIVYNFEVAGNHNYYVGRNQILAHNKGGSGGKKGGGGGSGGKAKTIEPKEKKEHQKDYYEEVNTQLDKTEKILSKIEKEEDRLIGDKARANQNKQLSLLQKEIDLNKEKQKIQQQELKDVDELMKKRTKEARELAIKNGITAIIPSPIYDEDGAIANYEEMSAAIDKIHNQFIDQYNAAAKAGNEELTKEIQKTLEKFDKYGDDLLKNAQRHDVLQSEIEETINTLEELEDSIEDIRIDAFKAHQEAQDDLKDLKEDAAELEAIFRDFDDDGFLTSWSLDDTPIDDMIKAMHELDDIYAVTQEDANKFYQDLIDKKEEALKNTTDKDEIAAIQSAIQYFQEQQANLGPDDLQNGLLGLANQDLDKLKGWIEGTNTEPNPFGKNEAALWEAYEDAYKRATDLFKDWRETVQDLRDSIIDTYDEQEDAINNNIDEYDRLLDHLERINDTYTLYYGEDSYDDILTIMDQQGATMQQQLNDLTTAFNYWEQRYQEAVENGDKKLIQEIREKMEDAEDAMYDKAEELAEHWVDRYKKAVDASIQKIDIKLWGGGPGQIDLEDQSTIWELQKDYMDTYRDDVEKAYEIDKLRSKYIGLLNDAQGMSLQTQNKIRAQMQEQLDLLENQGTMSEYDVKLANAKLEILQKQIALEDAQRNKNKMQLRRDTQGNYRYVYTAEQGDVQQAQDELNESQFDAYEMTKEQTIANNDRAVSLYQDYMNKMRDIANKYKDDDVARNEAMKALSEEYGKLLEALGEDFKDTTNGMYDVLTWMIENGTQDTATAAMDMLDQLYDKNGDVKENTGNDWRDFATQITDEVLPNIEDAVAEGLGNINNEAAKLNEDLTGDNGALTKIGSSTEELDEAMKKATDTTEKWAAATRDLFESFSPDNKKVQEAMTQLKQMEEQLSANQQATSALSTKYKQANSALQAKTAEAEHYKTALDFSTGAKQVKTGTVVKLKKGTAVHYSRNNSQTDKQGHYGWSLPYDMWVKFGEIDKGQANPYSFYATGDSLKQFGPIQNDDKSDNRGGEADTDKRHHQPWWFDQSELQKNVLAAMDTGGYTGSWNDNTSLYKNGKIAMLHQKELVLNAADTQNILAAVSLMRDLTRGSALGLSGMGNFGMASSSYNPITEQRVEIQASFPNATDADDIRTALLELSDKAYQYAHRTI